MYQQQQVASQPGKWKGSSLKKQNKKIKCAAARRIRALLLYYDTKVTVSGWVHEPFHHRPSVVRGRTKTY